MIRRDKIFDKRLSRREFIKTIVDQFNKESFGTKIMLGAMYGFHLQVPAV